MSEQRVPLLSLTKALLLLVGHEQRDRVHAQLACEYLPCRSPPRGASRARVICIVGVSATISAYPQPPPSAHRHALPTAAQGARRTVLLK